MTPAAFFPMRHIRIVLVRTRFPENIGMAARAAANMGISDLVLVNPERWDRDKAAPLATGKGLDVLHAARITPTLADALGGCIRAFGTTARTGGWRQQTVTPSTAAESIITAIAGEFGSTGCAVPETAIPAEKPAQQGAPEYVALVFGPEDKGLENAEIELCTDLVTIPTAPGASSLNLAQSVLLLAYECFTKSLVHACPIEKKSCAGKHSRLTTIQEQETLFASLQQVLERVDFLPKNNPEWFMLPLRRFFRRASLHRHEFDLFMGICRNISRHLRKTD